MNNSFERMEETVDFKDRLVRALANAIPEEQVFLHNQEVCLLYKDAPDDYVINGQYAPEAHVVHTNEPTQFMELLVQAAEVLNEDVEITTEQRVQIEAFNHHELAHGEATRIWGNSTTISYYGVAFVIDSEKQPSFIPFHSYCGPLKKIHHVLIAVAPENVAQEPSPVDLAVISDYGYGAVGVAELIRRAHNEPPVAEGWGSDFFGVYFAEAVHNPIFTWDD